MARRFLLAIGGQVVRLDYPRRTSAQLAASDDAAPNHAQRRHDAHIHNLRRRLERYLAPFGPLAFTIDGDAMVAAERADPRLGPLPCGGLDRLGRSESTEKSSTVLNRPAK